jgi:hypothetical protein
MMMMMMMMTMMMMIMMITLLILLDAHLPLGVEGVEPRELVVIPDHRHHQHRVRLAHQLLYPLLHRLVEPPAVGWRGNELSCGRNIGMPRARQGFENLKNQLEFVIERLNQMGGRTVFTAIVFGRSLHHKALCM